MSKADHQKQCDRIDKVLDNLKALCRNDPDLSDWVSGSLEGVLDELHGDGSFGSEGQCDPRGDFRNGDWSMMHVEGVDE